MDHNYLFVDSRADNRALERPKIMIKKNEENAYNRKHLV